MERSPCPACASSTRTTVAMFAVSISKSPLATIGLRVSAKKLKQASTCSPASKTTPNCAAYSTPRKSARGSSLYEIPPHSYRSAPVYRLYGGGVPFPLPCGYAFRVFHLPAVPPVHQDETRQAQRCFWPKGCGEGACKLEGIPSAWPRLSSFLTQSVRGGWQGECPFPACALDRIHPNPAHCSRLHPPI